MTKTVLRDAKTKKEIKPLDKEKVQVEEKSKEDIEEKIVVEEDKVEKLEDDSSQIEDKPKESNIEEKIEEIKVEKPQELKNSSFLLSIAKIEKNKLNAFINRYGLVDYKIRDLDDGNIEIYIGTYEDKKSALEKLSKYHPHIQSIAKIEKE
jgi:hypothetical protein